MVDIEKIKDPAFLKTLKPDELEQLCEDIRQFLILNLSKTGGHIGPNLGVVELTVAMHKLFDSPKDKFIFDVGHQAYTHKILTGRATQFPTLRQHQGLSGFPKRSESEHDAFETGHSSTSISAAAGFVYARDYKKEDYHVVAVIGDGALTGGMAFEALNHLGHADKRVIVVLNDNEMSISKNVGAFTGMLNKMRLNKKYTKAKSLSRHLLHKEKHVFGLARRVRDGVKSFFLHSNIFEQMGFQYFGPFDGHNLPVLEKAFACSKAISKPVLIHVVTQKGKGYKPAEDDAVGIWHGCGPFDIKTGKTIAKKPKNEKSWSIIISEIVTKLARNDDKIVAITPAMKAGSSLDIFEREFPDRLIDVGIAEQHALTFAGGLVADGMKPFVAIYSTFLQRAYDQLNHDLARQELPVVIGIDRSGLVDGDGDTHQGIYDIAMVRHIPNLNLMMPKDAKEAYDMLYTAFLTNKLALIRYPRGNTSDVGLDDYAPKKLIYGTWTKEEIGDDLILITYGQSVQYLTDIVKRNELKATVVNARFIKPLDEEMLEALIKMDKPIIVFEEAIKAGSLNSAILEFLQTRQLPTSHISSMAIDDRYVDQGKRELVYPEIGLDEATILAKINEITRVD